MGAMSVIVTHVTGVTVLHATRVTRPLSRVQVTTFDGV